MFVEQLIKEKEECIVSYFLEEGGIFLVLAGYPPSLLSFFLYLRKPQVSILQNSPPLSRLFTFKYFNNYFPKKGEIALHEIFKIWLRGAKLLK